MLATPLEPGFRSLGQPSARRSALRAAGGGRLSRTFLVHGPTGSGKGAFVDDLLALLFCTAAADAEHPCNACDGCRRARARTHPDLVPGSPEAWRDLRGTGESIVGAARRWLGEAAGAPIAGERRVILIEGADRAGEAIQNTLLKVLEEPTDRHVFVLVAAEPSQLLPTIRSRCQPLRIGPVPRADLAGWLAGERRLEPDEAELLSRISEGFVGRALALAADPAARTWRLGLQRELLDLLSAGRAARLIRARELLDTAMARTRPPADGDAGPNPDEPETRTPTSLQRAGATAIVETWIALARDLLVTAGGRPEAAAALSAVPQIQGAAARLGTARLVEFLGVMERVHAGLADNASARLALDRAMLAWPELPAS